MTMQDNECARCEGNVAKKNQKSKSEQDETSEDETRK
jgi:hypothetical protein